MTVLAASRTTIPKPAWVAIGSELVMNALGFMALPVLAVYLDRDRHFSLASIGTALTVLLVASRLLPVATGALADLVGHRVTGAAGAAFRAAGFGLMAIGSSWPVVLLGALLIGAGGALYEPSVTAVLAGAPAPVRARVFVRHNQALNLGVIIGPAAASVVLVWGGAAIFAVSAAACAVMAMVLAALLPSAAVGVRAPGSRVSVLTVFGDRAFRRLWLLVVPWWVLFAQLNVGLPARAVAVGGSVRWVGPILLANGIAGIAAMFVVGRLSDRLTVRRALVAGYLLVGTGFALVAAAPGITWLIGCVVLYTFGESVMLLFGQLGVAALAPDGAKATYFGAYAASWAAGGAIGNFVGTSFALHGGTAAVWLALGATGWLAALATARQLRPAPARD